MPARNGNADNTYCTGKGWEWGLRRKPIRNKNRKRVPPCPEGWDFGMQVLFSFLENKDLWPRPHFSCLSGTPGSQESWEVAWTFPCVLFFFFFFECFHQHFYWKPNKVHIHRTEFLPDTAKSISRDLWEWLTSLALNCSLGWLSSSDTEWPRWSGHNRNKEWGWVTPTDHFQGLEMTDYNKVFQAGKISSILALDWLIPP